MSISTLEKRLKKRGYKIIIGLDEVGRGALSGSVIAVAVSVQKFSIFNHQFLKELKDSKKLSPQKREKIFKMLGNLSGVEWGIGRVSERIIDKINVLQATKLAMERAIDNLISKNKKKSAKVDFLLIDGNFSINSNIPQKSIVKGDEKIFLIKLASIIAKVSRDKSMLRYHKQYPQYRFDKHKGYGTRLHFKMLKKYGPCKIHRKSFNPIKNYCKN
jgi:ribonuclease HII